MKLYFLAAKIIDLFEEEHKSIKSAVYNATVQNKKALYAVICQTLRYSQVLKLIMEKSGFLKEQKLLKGNLAYVLVYEMLFGSGVRSIKGKYLQILLKFKSCLKAELARLKLKQHVFKNEHLIHDDKGADLIPRYVRVNTLKLTVEKAIRLFQSEGYKMIIVEQNIPFKKYIEVIRGLKSHEFVIDIHIDHILVFAAGIDLHKHPLYCSGQIILQDKASCMSSYMLGAQAGYEVIDACAAPGNKTTHLAALTSSPTGGAKVFAVDKDVARVAVLRKLVAKALPSSSNESRIEIIHSDFLSVNPHCDKYKHVRYILVDPSCSGSGITNRLEKFSQCPNESEALKTRLQSLAAFQEKILLHALRFPGVEKVVYSTCSIHSEENEQVISKVMNNDAAHKRFELQNVLPHWPMRGQKCAGLPNAAYCIRASPQETMTHGFFIALLRRTSTNVENVKREASQTGRKRKNSKKKRKRLKTSKTGITTANEVTL